MRLPILTIFFLLTWGLKCFGQDYTVEMGAPNTSESINSYVFVDDENIIYCGGLIDFTNYISVIVGSKPKFRLLYGKYNVKTKSHVWAYSIDWAKSEEGTTWGGGTYEKIIKLINGELLMYARSNRYTNDLLVTKIDNGGNIIYHRQFIGTDFCDFDEGNNNEILAIGGNCFNVRKIYKFNHLSPISTVSDFAINNPQGSSNVVAKSPNLRKIICEKGGGDNNAFYIASDIYSFSGSWNVNCITNISFMKFSNQNVLSSFVFQNVLSLNSFNNCSILHYCNSFTLEGDFAQISYNYGEKLGIAKFNKNSGTILTNNLFDRVISGSSSYPGYPSEFIRGFHNAQRGNMIVRTRQDNNTEKNYLILESDNTLLGSKYSTVNYIMKDLVTNDCQIWNNHMGFHALSAGNNKYDRQIIISNKKLSSTMACNTGIINNSVSQQFSQFSLGIIPSGLNECDNLNSQIVSLPRVSHNFTVSDLECVPCLTLPNIQSQDITYPNPE
jgi:hypothetical protein